MPVKAQIVPSEAHLGAVGGALVQIGATFTRPADTTAYAANDAIADSTSAPTVLTFPNVARLNGGSGYVTRVRILTDQATNVAQFRLWLYHTAPTAINDNAACTAPLYVDAGKLVGSIDLGPVAQEGSGATAAFAQDILDRLPFVCDSNDRNLYGILETKTAFTPASGQKFDIELVGDLN